MKHQTFDYNLYKLSAVETNTDYEEIFIENNIVVMFFSLNRSGQHLRLIFNWCKFSLLKYWSLHTDVHESMVVTFINYSKKIRYR